MLENDPVRRQLGGISRPPALSETLTGLSDSLGGSDRSLVIRSSWESIICLIPYLLCYIWLRVVGRGIRLDAWNRQIALLGPSGSIASKGYL